MVRSTAGDVWVFGYGSLMWRPDFCYVEARPARIHGYHRSLCVWSHHHRGTRAHPGLVLGLARGGSCKGWAFRVAASEWPRALIALNERELKSHPTDPEGDVYEPRFVCATFDGGERVRAFVYVVNPCHPQFAGGLTLEHMAEVVATARGESGLNIDYLKNTVAHLADLGISDPPLSAVLRLTRRQDREG